MKTQDLEEANQQIKDLKKEIALHNEKPETPSE